ncbi:MAG: oligosaccharide flippase family protein [Verrucomicrobiales bacterium]
MVTPILIIGLGEEQYGIWLLLMTFFSYYNLLDLGVGIASVRFMARALGDGKGHTELVAVTCRRFFRRVALASLILTFTGVGVLFLLFDHSQTLLSAQLVIAICGLGITMRFILMIYQVIIKSHLRYGVIAGASMLRILVQSILVIWLVRSGHGLVALAMVVAACDFGQQIVQYLFARRLVGKIDSSRTGNDEVLGAELLRYSMTSFAMKLSLTLKDRIDPYLVGGVLGAAAVPLYSIGTRFLFVTGDIINALFGGHFLAAFSRLEAEGDQSALRKKFLLSLRLCAAFTTFIAGVFAAQAGVFIERWLGGRFGESYVIFLIIVVPYALYMMQYPSLSLMGSLNKHAHVTKVTAAGSVINVVLSVALAIHFGLKGVAWATAIDLGLVYLILFPRVVCFHSGIRGNYYLLALARGMIPTAVAMYGSYLALREWMEPDYSRIVMIGLIQTALFCAVFWIFVLKGGERAWVACTLKERGGSRL